MTERPDLSNLPSYRQPRRSVFSARKIALMASVVAGFGAAVYGFSPSVSPADLFSSPAHAQVNNEVRKVERPVGFADIVERVKPSVISVKVNIKEKTAATMTATIPPRRSSRARRWSASSAASAVRTASPV
jgi:serine protease Do